MNYTRLFAPLLLAASIAAVGTSANAADSTPAKLGDYQPVGFLSDYSQLKPEGGDSNAYVRHISPDVGGKYNKVMIDRIQLFLADQSAY